MVPLAVIITVLLVALADLLIRTGMERSRASRLRAEREKALAFPVRLEIAEQARTLQRVEVPNPRARILAVDDEEVVLDSFRKVLVLEGYCVDTVQEGPEALALLKSEDYDFLFTDLKMPVMDGVEVTKAAKHIRPDVDVIVVTGYASVESAVETMKYGAMDYVQKPFAPEELAEFVKNAVIRRKARLDYQLCPKAALITPAAKEPPRKEEFCLWGGVFLSASHTWAAVEPSGAVKIGLDDFVQKALGRIDAVLLPVEGQDCRKGDFIIGLRVSGRTLRLPSPFSGKIEAVNRPLLTAPQLINRKPYDAGWICRISAVSLSQELRELRVGSEALSWFQGEIDRYFGAGRPHESDALQFLAHSFLGAVIE